MNRPVEYDNLLRTNTFKEAASSNESIRQFIKTAEGMHDDASAPLRDSARFLLASERMFSVVMAVLEFHGVRPGDGSGHRATAIARVAADLKLNPARQSVLARLHDVRNRVTYRQPLPPITKADADALQIILHEMLSAAKALIGAG